MPDIIFLGAACSGVTKLARAVSRAFDLPMSDVDAQPGTSRRAYPTNFMHASREILDVQDQFPPHSMGSDLASETVIDRSLPHVSMEKSCRLISTPDKTSDCANLKQAHSLLQASHETKAIVVWRHGVDFINGRLRSFPHTDFATHCLCWSSAIREMISLADAFPSRVSTVEHSAMYFDGDATVAMLKEFLAFDAGCGEQLSVELANLGAYRRIALFGKPVTNPAKAAWSMAEVEVYGKICGDASRAIGCPVNISSAEIVRPIDLAGVLLDRGRALGSFRIGPPSKRNSGPVITCVSARHQSGALHLSPIAAGQRRILCLGLEVAHAEDGAELVFEVVETLTRRPLLRREIPLRAGSRTNLRIHLPNHEGLLDIIFSANQPCCGQGFIATIAEAGLSNL